MSAFGFLSVSQKLLQVALNRTPTIPVRGKKRLNIPKLRYPVWFIRSDRILHDEKITKDNTKFIDEVISDKFGPPAIISGIPTYKSPLKTAPVQTVAWQPYYKRTGVIARKIGIYPLWLKDGTKISTTLLQVFDNHVIKYTPPEEYVETRERTIPVRRTKRGCLLVGSENVNPSLYTKAYCGLFEKQGLMPKKIIARFFVSPEAALAPGTPLSATHFRVGDYVDVRGKTVDRGFQGVVKRWGFKGGPASHGCTKTHRRPGNIGAGGEKSRVWPGTKMPGHMGNVWRVLKGLKIWRINTKYNVLYVSGQNVPGSTNSHCYVYDTILPLRRGRDLAFPTCVNADELPEDVYDEQVHRFDDETITFSVEE